jgi:ADP-heptose:LPS heptosyltransferase
MGDVAMTVPVVKQLLEQYPALHITFVSDEKFSSLFQHIPRLEFYAADIRGKYHGFLGLLRLFNDLKKTKNIHAIADLHDVLRTKVLTFLFRLTGTSVKRIDKGRKEKKALTRKDNKKLVQLPTTFQRYANVFARLGHPFKLIPSIQRIKLQANETAKELSGNDNITRIGIAPFAKHKEKTYPLAEMEKVISYLANKGHKIFLFGGGNEISQLEDWQNQFKNVLNIAGKLSFEEELMLISNLDIMISMDSANMHLASLYGVPVISIWGATHPFAGFYGFAQNPLNAVQSDIYCRPCSVFGNKPCYRGDWACMGLISPQHIIDKIETVLQSV